MDLLLANEFLRSVMMSNSNVLEFKTEVPHLITRETISRNVPSDNGSILITALIKTAF